LPNVSSFCSTCSKTSGSLSSNKATNDLNSDSFIPYHIYSEFTQLNLDFKDYLDTFFLAATFLGAAFFAAVGAFLTEVFS
jgi:hypothetical protein